MICQNCHATVADGLTFCTECGTRLQETLSQTPTVMLNDSVITKISAADSPKPKSNLGWIALIVALIALPISLFIAYRLYTTSKTPATVADSKPTNKSQAPASTKQPINSSVPSNPVNTNSASEAGSNTNLSSADQTANDTISNEEGSEIWSDHIEIAPGTHLAVPFEIEADSKITGNIKTLQGAPVEGYVYLQKEYDEHFPDAIYKVFSFGGEKESKIDQTLVKENYVLVFVNNSKAPMMIEGNVAAAKHKSSSADKFKQ